MKTLRVLTAALLASSALAASPLTPTGLSQAQAATGFSCVTSSESNGTIYIRNGCGFTIWWVACVRFSGSATASMYGGTGLTPGGDYDFSPGPGTFSYYVQNSDTVAWSPQC